jgi:hypothetical protein
MRCIPYHTLPYLHPIPYTLYYTLYPIPYILSYLILYILTCLFSLHFSYPHTPLPPYPPTPLPPYPPTYPPTYLPTYPPTYLPTLSRMRGSLPESCLDFIRSIMDFERRGKWESSFSDGVTVDSIVLPGEEKSVGFLTTEELSAVISKKKSEGQGQGQGQGQGIPPSPDSTRPTSSFSTTATGAATGTGADSSISTFLSGIDVAGVPEGMSVAYLNEPSRQRTLAHLRKQMVASLPGKLGA